MLAAAIFDFDGLIVDTETPAFEAWSQTYLEYGCELELAQWVRCVGADYLSGFDPVINLAALLGARGDARAATLDRAALLAAKDARKKAICDRLDVLPGFHARIAEARTLGLKTAVASSSSRAWVVGHIERLGLGPCFDAVRVREDVARIKPFPDVYLATASALGVAPEACIVLEDSLNGVRAAKAAGMHCVAVPNVVTRSLDFSAADRVVGSLEELRFAEMLQFW